MVKIGFKAFLDKFFVTLLENKCDNPLLPLVLNAIKSGLISREKFKIPVSIERSL